MPIAPNNSRGDLLVEGPSIPGSMPDAISGRFGVSAIQPCVGARAAKGSGLQSRVSRVQIPPGAQLLICCQLWPPSLVINSAGSWPPMMATPCVGVVNPMS